MNGLHSRIGLGRAISSLAVLVCAAWLAPAALGQTVEPAGGGIPSTEPEQPSEQPAKAKEKERPIRARLSDERKVTRWATPVSRAVVRKRPNSKSRRITRLRFYTETGRPEVYLAKRSYIPPRGQEWIELRLPMRPNGRRGWVRRSALGAMRTVDTFLKIARGRLSATLYRRGRPVWRSPIGIGAPGTPTPAGDFWIRELLYPLRPGTVYGALAFGTSAYSGLSDWPGGGVVGLHGTNQPGLIPGRPSHGCIRVPNGAALKLRKLMPVGTPVKIV